MEYDYLFPSIVGRKTLNEDNSGIFEFCQNKRKESEGRVRSNDKGWQSNDLLWDEIKNNPAMTSLLATIEELSNQYRHDVGWREDAWGYISNWWININSRNSTNKIHMHPCCYFSGAYYVKADPEVHGTIVFRTPIVGRLSMMDHGIDPNPKQGWNPTTSASWEYKPKTGNFLIFPSWLEHFVEPNKTDEERISISFNILSSFNESA